MKSFVSIVFIFLITFVSTVFAQHEGIERHFNEYSIEEHIFENDFYSADTLTDNFHKFYSEYPFYFSTGNMALPAHSAFFADFNQTHDFIFYEGYTNFVCDLDNAKFFDARKPFTRIKYIGGAKKLDDISFVHTQNVKPWFNIGAEYRSVNSEGHYANQQLKAHAAHLFSDYRKNRYWGHFDLVYNKINHQENGGIESDSIFRLNVQRPANLGVNLHSATVRLGNIGARYRHNIKLGAGYNDTIIVEKDSLPIKRYPSRFSIGQDLSFNRYHRVYDDIPSNFYQNIFLDSVATHDSLGVLMFNHGLYLQYNLAGLNNKFPNAIIRLEFLNEIKLYSIDAFVHDPFVRLSTYGLENKHDWRFAFAYCFADVHLGEFYLDADYKYALGNSDIHFIKASLNFRNEYPEDFYFNAVFNNFEWKLDREPFTDYKFGVGYENTRWNTDFNINYTFLGKYLYFDQNALPKINQNSCNVLSASLSQFISFGVFNWNNEIRTQYFSDKSVYDLPALGVHSSLYIKTKFFDKKLGFQTGVDFSWMTQSKGFAYMPATGVFYRNEYREYGNFIVLDFHASILIKRFRGFIKLSHFNQAFMKANYFSLLHYPLNPLSFNFGISWEFYD